VSARRSPCPPRCAGVEKGDYLEAEVVEGGLLLEPVALVDRETAKARLNELLLACERIGRAAARRLAEGLRAAATRALTERARDVITLRRCNNGKEVIPCLTLRWRVAQVRRTRLRSRPPGLADAAGNINPSKPA